MQRLWIGICLLILAFQFNFPNALSGKAAGPRLFIKEKSVDYKQVDEGEVIEHAFSVFNKGDQALIIRNVKPG